MSINVTTETLKIGDKVQVTRDGQTSTMTVWWISPPGSGATRVSAGPLIHAQIRPGGFGQTFDYSTTGITVDPHAEEPEAVEEEGDRTPDPTPEGPRVWTSAELAAAFRDTVPVHGGRDGRSVERTVTLHEEADGTTTAATLSVMHHKEAKVLMANVKIVRHEPASGDSRFNVTTWIPFEKTHNRRLPNTPCPRYSAKLLAAADTAALDLLTEEPDWLDTLDLGPYSGSL